MDTQITPGSIPSMLTTSSQIAPNKGQDQKSQFLALLVAQLKGQNPLDPKDGTEFVSQLAQFSSLEELINIRTTLENLENLSKLAMTAPSTNPFQGNQGE
jgi:flagellar basal-body rod modification protein FlgD